MKSKAWTKFYQRLEYIKSRKHAPPGNMVSKKIQTFWVVNLQNEILQAAGKHGKWKQDAGCKKTSKNKGNISDTGIYGKW